MPASITSTKGGYTPPSPKATKEANDRRGSSSSGKFSGLMNQKRESTDIAQARRQSFADQKPATGVIGSMWNKFTTGHDGK